MSNTLMSVFLEDLDGEISEMQMPAGKSSRRPGQFVKVEERSPRLTVDQWRCLEMLEAGWVMVSGSPGRYSLVKDYEEKRDRYTTPTLVSLLKREMLELLAPPAVKVKGYYLSAGGVKALRLRRQNRAGSGEL